MKTFKLDNKANFVFAEGEIFGLECSAKELNEILGAVYALDEPKCKKVTMTNGSVVTRS